MRAQKLVERALKEYPQTRGSDRHLIIAVWHYQNPDWKYDPVAWILTEAMSPETITRWRRKLQEQGRYLPEDKITEARYDKYKEARSGNLEAL